MSGLTKKLINQYTKYLPKIATKNILYHFFTRERRKTFGPENPGRTIYIIRSIADYSPYYIGPVHNLMANYFYVLSHLRYAKHRGWLPVVDQLNYPVYNSQKQPVNGSNNPWEYFWMQPSDITLKEAYVSRDVVLSKQSWFGEWDIGYETAHYTDTEMIMSYHELAAAARLNDTTKTHVCEARRQFIPAGKKVLGVNVRIGGHAKQARRHGAGHPIQPEIDELIAIVDKRRTEWGMDFLLLASDTESAVEQFKHAFGDLLIIYPRQRAVLGTEYALDSQKILYAPDKSYQTALDYLTEMELLADCNALIGAVTSGFRYAVVQNGTRFEHIEVLDRGRFEDERRK